MRDRLNSTELGRRVNNGVRSLREAIGRVRLRGEVRPTPLPEVDEAEFKKRQEHEENRDRARKEIKKALESQDK
jgi:hypothetical protein